MKRFLLTLGLLVGLAAPLGAQQTLPLGSDQIFFLQFVDEAAGTPLSAITAANFTGILEQPEQHNGAQLQSNGTFGDATGWTLGGTWAVGGGTLNAVNETGTTACTTINPVEGIAYRVTFTITSYTDGTITVSVGGTSGTARSSAATFTEVIVAGPGTTLCFTGGTAATASIDNLVVSQNALRFTPSATIGADWATIIAAQNSGDVVGNARVLVPVEALPVGGTYCVYIYDAAVNLALSGCALLVAESTFSFYTVGPSSVADITTALYAALIADNDDVVGSVGELIALINTLGIANNRVNSNVTAMAVNVVNASAVSDTAANEIALATWAATTRQLSGTQAFNLTGNVTGNLSGSVGSVTGSVGSVTGAVGSVTGNVGGSTASVVGAVGSVTGNVGGNVVGSVASVDSLGATARAQVTAAATTVPAGVAFPYQFTMFSNTGTSTPGYTVACRILIDGTWSNCDNAVVDRSEGAYSVIVSATETATPGSRATLKLTATGAQEVWQHLIVQ